MAIKFGTEGWRAIMADEFTVDNVRIVAQAIAEHVRAAAGRTPVTVAVGYDTRFLSDAFARTVCEVLSANRIKSVLSESSVPTCAASRYVVKHRLACGIMVTASHNPPTYNGIKVKEAFGGSATTETIGSIERRLGAHPVKRVALHEALSQGLVRRADFLPDYLGGIRAYVNLPAIRKSRLRVVVDPMHGAGDRIVEKLLSGGRCRIETLHGDPDPRFGGRSPEPILKNLGELKARLRKRRWDIGLATDGDADRIGAVSPTGQFLNPGQILCVLVEHLMATRGWRGTIVKTVSNTSMIDRLADAHGLPLIEVPVGFKHVAKLMMEQNVLIGGEESGGIGVRGYLPERDGILLGLLLLEAMAAQEQGIIALLKDVERRFGRWVYARRDLAVSFAQVDRFFAQLHKQPPSRIAGESLAHVKTLDGVKLIGRGGSWLLFRRSGTEPIVRVYAESLSPSRVPKLLDVGVQLIKRA